MWFKRNSFYTFSLKTSAKTFNLLALRNMKYLFILYRRQRNNYIARKRRILAAIILKLQKRKRFFLKLLNLIKHKINLLESLPQKRMGRTRRFQKSNLNWWTTLSKTYSDERFRQTFWVSRTTFHFVLSKVKHRICKSLLSKHQSILTKDLQFPYMVLPGEIILTR